MAIRQRPRGCAEVEDAATVLLFTLVASGQIKFAQNRRLAEDRCHAQPEHRGGGVIIRRKRAAEPRGWEPS
jgi:hypothetical protein